MGRPARFAVRAVFVTKCERSASKCAAVCMPVSARWSGTKIGGIAVHIGARVAAAEPGEVLVSSTVKDLVAGSGIAYKERGEHVSKGLPGEWSLFHCYGAG